MRTALAAVAVILGLLVGCGGAHEGGPCSGAVYHCDSSTSILECRANVWVAIPCAGPGGCSTVPGGLACDVSGNAEGDGCPTAMEGTGFCRGTSPQSLFTCRNHTVVKLQDCQTCSTSGSSIVCTP